MLHHHVSTVEQTEKTLALVGGPFAFSFYLQAPVALHLEEEDDVMTSVAKGTILPIDEITEITDTLKCVTFVV